MEAMLALVLARFLEDWGTPATNFMRSLVLLPSPFLTWTGLLLRVFLSVPLSMRAFLMALYGDMAFDMGCISDGLYGGLIISLRSLSDIFLGM